MQKLDLVGVMGGWIVGGIMVKTLGSRDLKPRKKRKFYAGKLIKKKRMRHGRLVPYVSKRDRNAPIKVWFWEVRPMKKDSWKNFSRKTRPYIKRVVYVPLLRIDVDSERLSNVEAIKQLALETIGYSGSFLLKMFCHAKNQYRVTNRTVAKIKITETPSGLRVEIYENFRISRYWFFKG